MDLHHVLSLFITLGGTSRACNSLLSFKEFDILELDPWNEPQGPVTFNYQRWSAQKYRGTRQQNSFFAARIGLASLAALNRTRLSRY